MNACHFAAAFALAAMLSAPAVAASSETEAWGRVAAPSSGPPQVIGGPMNGCLAGAAALPPAGPGYQAIRLTRHRNYGHPATVAFVERLGREARQSGLEPFYIGDMAQPRGGPMSSGHAAHETGVDVDIWFDLDPKPPQPATALETLDPPSMVLKDGSDIDPQRFGEHQVRLLRLAARDAAVDRIFVNPTIKRALCRGFGTAREGDASWLHKIRPWYGHAAHFHVRLACPADSPACVGQSPVPAGNGCDTTLDWWFELHPPAPTPGPPPPPKPPLPAACQALLQGE
jgi:penicillin-insensitive murein endopeptidase